MLNRMPTRNPQPLHSNARGNLQRPSMNSRRRGADSRFLTDGSSQAKVTCLLLLQGQTRCIARAPRPATTLLPFDFLLLDLPTPCARDPKHSALQTVSESEQAVYQSHQLLTVVEFFQQRTGWL